MNVNNYPDILPGKKPIKRTLNKTLMFVLGRALQSLSKNDPLIQHELNSWPDDFVLMIVVQPNGGSMAVQKVGENRLRYCGSHFPQENANVVIFVKSVESAFAMFSGQLGIDVAYAQHAMCAKGDLSYTVSVVRTLMIAEAYLFPSIMVKRIVKQMPPIPVLRKHLLRLKTYTLGILLGI